MQPFIRVVAGVCAVALIVFGIMQPVEQEVRWLMCLWAAAPLLGVAAWLYQAPMPRGLNRSVHNLGLVVSVGFVLLSLQLLRQQVVQADATYNRVNIDSDSGQITSNVRPVLDSQRVMRGAIFDRTGTVLVSSEVVADGFVRRTYPIVDSSGVPAAFSNIVGFFSTRFGQGGIEATYGDFLSGERGNTLSRLKDDILGNPQVGNDLYLSLDARLQVEASALLGGRYGSVVVLDPASGAILSMVSSPGFDSRQLSFNYAADDWASENARIGEYWSYLNSDGAGQPLLNRPTQGQYPPGSTFKTVTSVGVLEYAGDTEPNDIRCFNEYVPPEPGSPPVVNAVPNLSSLTGDPTNLERVYAYSCNVAFAQYAIRLGTERMEKQAALFDIYTPEQAPKTYPEFRELPTVPSLLYTQPGFLDRPAALADTGYGQGQLLVSPLQMAMVAAAIANDGIMMRPYLVERIMPPENEAQQEDNRPIYVRTPEAIRRTMTSETASTMRDNMRAVGQYGFGKDVNLVPGVMVGGKSGTAEHVPGATPHSWFIAIAPVDKPRYVVCAMVESGGEGSSVAAMLAGQVLRAAFALE